MIRNNNITKVPNKLLPYKNVLLDAICEYERCGSQNDVEEMLYSYKEVPLDIKQKILNFVETPFRFHWSYEEREDKFFINLFTEEGIEIYKINSSMSVIEKLTQLDLVKHIEKNITKDYMRYICLANKILEYFSVNPESVEEYYKLEYLLALFNLCDCRGIEYDKTIKDIIQQEYNNILSYLNTNMINTIRVWLIRELYYFDEFDYSPSGKKLLNYLVTGNKEKFMSSYIVKSISSFKETNPEVYFNVFNTFKKTFSLSPSAQFNVLLNLCHCNGDMSSKFIDTETIKSNVFDNDSDITRKFLNELSNKNLYYNKDFYKLTGINPNILFYVESENKEISEIEQVA